MSESQNFYTSGGTLGRSARSYVTRCADNDLLRHLLHGDFCYVLTSRQMGKSSLMVRTANALRNEGVHVAILDLTRIGQNVSPEQWYYGLLGRLAENLDLEDELEEYCASDRVSRMGPMQRFMGALREVVLPTVKGRIAIFVDEIDAVRSLPFSSDEFFAGIRECYNSRAGDPEFNRVSFCLLGVAQPSDLISNVYITPFNIGHRIELTDFTETEARPLLEGLRDRSSKVKGPEAILRRVLYWTGGHPYLTQKLCEAVGQLEKKDISPRDVDLVCGELFLSSRSREQQDNLIFVRDRVLASKEQRTEILDLYAQIRSRKKVRDDDTSALIDTLRLSGLAVVKNNRLIVRNRIYNHVFDKRWIRLNMPDAELRRQRRAFRRGLGIAIGIAAVVLGVVVALVAEDLKDSENSLIGSYADNMTQAQQAFDTGDFGVGTGLIKQWVHADNYHHWWGKYKKYEPVIAWQQYQTAQRKGFEWKWLVARSSGESAITYNEYGSGSSIGAIDIRNIVISPDDRWAASGGADVRIFDLKKPCPTNSPGYLTAMSGAPIQPTLPPSIPCQLSTVLYIDDTGKPIPLAPASDKEIEKQIEKLSPAQKTLPTVMALQFSPDGNWLAIATGYWSSSEFPGKVYLWRLSGGEPVLVQSLSNNSIRALAYNSKSGELATVDINGSAKFFNIRRDGTAKEDPTQEYNSVPTRLPDAAAFSPDGMYFAISFNDGHLAIKNMKARDDVTSIPLDISGLPWLTFYDDNTILAGSKDGDIKQVDCRTFKWRQVIAAGQGLIASLMVSKSKSKDGDDLLVSAGTDSTVRVWQLEDHEGKVEAWSPSILRGHRGKVWSAAITSDQKLIVSGGADGTVRFWVRQPNVDFGNDIPGQDDTPNFASQPDGFRAEGVVRALAFSPWDDHRLVYLRGIPEVGDEKAACPKEGSEVFFYDLVTRSKPLGICAHHGNGTAVAYSGNGHYVATGAEDGSVMLWDTKQVSAAYKPITLPLETAMGTDVEPPMGTNKEPIAGLAFSDDGNILAVSNKKSISLWQPNSDPQSGTVPYKFIKEIPLDPGGTPGALAFSPHGKLLAVCRESTVEILKTDDPRKGEYTSDPTVGDKGVLTLSGPCNAVAFSGDSNWFATGTVTPELDLRDIKDNWKKMDGDAAPTRPEANINAVAFSPDSKILAYATTDSKILLWSLSDKKPRPTVAVHIGGVWSIAFSPNGNCLASGSTDDTLRITPTADLNLEEMKKDDDWIPFGLGWSSCVGPPENFKEY